MFHVLLERPIIAAVAAVSATLAFSAPTQAGSIDLSAYGWLATFDDNVDLTVLSSSSGGVVLSLQKFADFTTAPDANGVIQPLSIVFRQVSRNAVRQIAFEEETVLNDTGVNWSGFRFSVLSSGGSNAVTFDTAKSADFSTDPFPNKSYSQDDSVLTVSGGTLGSGSFPDNLWQPGRTSGGLFINANPFTSGSQDQTFVFSEQPLAGTTPPVIIPLPASAFMTLSGLALAGLAGFVRSRRATR